jgi:hypothetical protein
MDGFIRRIRCARFIPIVALLLLQCNKASLADGIDGDVQPYLPFVRYSLTRSTEAVSCFPPSRDACASAFARAALR